MDDAVALLDGIVAREDVLGVVVAKWQVKGVKSERLLKNTPLTREFMFRWTCGCAFALVCGLINHGRTRTALTNVRADTGFAERKRGMSVLVRGSKPFVLCDDAIPGKLFSVEVYDISNRQSGCLEVVHELGLVLRQNCLDGLEFENDPVITDEVGYVLLLKRPAAKVYRQRMFAFERYAGVAKRNGEGLLIDRLEESGAELAEYVHADSENFVGCFSFCKHLVVPLGDGFLFNHGHTRTGFARPLAGPSGALRAATLRKQSFLRRISARPDSELESVVRGLQAVHALRRFSGRPCRGRGAQVRACCRQNRMGRLWSLEQIGMGAGAGQFKNEDVFVYLVDTDDIRHFARSFQSLSRSEYEGWLGSCAMRSPSSMAAMVSAFGTWGPSMMKGMRFSRTTVLMYTVITEDAESPTLSQNSTKRFLVGASSENVMFAMVFLHSFELKTRISYTKMSGFVKGERNHGLTRTGLTNARPGLSFAERERGMSVLVCGLNNHGLARTSFAWLAACAYPPSEASREAGSTRGARPPYPDGRTAMERRPYQDGRKRKRRWVVSLAQYPFAEKGAAEAVFPVVVVDYVLSFKFGDGLFDGCGVEDLCRFEEGAGEYLPAAADGYGAENARLLRGKGCYAKRRCAKRYYTIWHNKEDVSDFAWRLQE